MKKKRTVIDLAEFRKRAQAGKKMPPTAEIRLVAPAQEPVAAQDTRTVSFVFSDSSVDRYGDTIDARGWALDNFKANPIALFGHDSGTVENVIGNARNVRVEGNRLIGDIEFMTAEVNPNAEVVYQMVKGGYLKTVSVGFQPLEWNLAKDKGRPGGVDFKKQELLEISIVPLPANPNALIQAKAAGIEIERIGLTAERDGAPLVSKKGLYEVSFLAHILMDLGYLEDMVEWEEDYEGDGSDISQRLTDALKLLGQVLVDMTAEEVAELIGEEDSGEPPIVLVDDPGELSLTPSQKALHAIVRGMRAARAKPINQTVALSIEMTQESKDLLAQIERAGKVLSGANEKSLRDAHAAITQGCETIKSVLDAATGGDDGGSDDGAGDDQAAAIEARKKRQRVVDALKLAHAS